MPDNQFSTDVLVVGSGPAGLATALTLAKHGIDTTVITKYRSTAHTPRAHITNQRTVEIFRDLGVEDEVLSVATPSALMANNVWATSFSGEEIARLLTWGNHPKRKHEYEAASPSPMCNIPQHLLEPILANAVTQSNGRIRFLNELIEFSQNEDGVRASVLDRQAKTHFTVDAKYMVGADGANSMVVENLGLPLSGQARLGAALNVWIEADLTKYCAHRPGVLYWMLRPGNSYWVGSGTFICVRLWREWSVLFMYDPEEGEPDTSEEALLARLRSVIGDDTISVKIKAVGNWNINHVVAETYGKGRIFCAGDAVHRHPPANGLGTNTSVQDGYNLGWKLAYVLKGWAGERLLETYSEERQPVGRKIVDRAMQSVGDMKPIADALGFEPGQSEEDGWKGIDRLKDSGPEAEAKRKALKTAIELQNYQFNCHGVELNQHYVSTAIASEDGPCKSLHLDDLHYHPSTRAGGRLPHAWITQKGHRVSIHDICLFGAFTLITGSNGKAWCDAAEQLAAESGIPLKSVQIGPGKEFEDPYFEWAELREVESDGCVLVRPDKHVAFRSNRSADNAHNALSDIFKTILSRQ